ncbi:MAG: PEP-CTERM sorting domain-containing protein [Verrucomicrobiota bacterium]|jgi:hypothetical protein
MPAAKRPCQTLRFALRTLKLECSHEFTPGGVKSVFASGLSVPEALAIDSTGDLFEGDGGSGNVYEFTPGGSRTTVTAFGGSYVSILGLAVQPVPEPSALSLLAVGAAAFLSRRRNWRP